MATSTTIIQSLPPLEWKGQRAPFASLDTPFGNRLAAREYFGVDGEGHQATGRKSLTMSGRLFFVNTVEGQTEAFPKNWNRWWPVLKDGTAGKLVHPIFGEMRARVETGTVRLAAQNTAGIEVDVNWVETNEDVDKPNEIGPADPDAYTVVKAAQVAIDTAGIPWPATAPGTSLLDAVNQLLSGAFSAQLTVSGQLTQIIGAVQNMIGRAALLTDPLYSPAYDNLIVAWGALKTMAAQAAPARTVLTVTIAHDSTLETLADQYSNSLVDMMGLNTALLYSPIVPANSLVSYYAGA